MFQSKALNQKIMMKFKLSCTYFIAIRFIFVVELPERREILNFISPFLSLLGLRTYITFGESYGSLLNCNQKKILALRV